MKQISFIVFDLVWLHAYIVVYFFFDIHIYINIKFRTIFNWRLVTLLPHLNSGFHLFILLYFFKYYFRSFLAVHDWHIDVHEDKSIGSKITVAWRVEAIVVFVDGLSTI